MNTKERGQFTLVIFKTPKNKEYVGFCYELAIVLSDKNQERLRKDLLEAVKGYVETVRENNLSNKLLNRHKMLPSEYRQLYEFLEKSLNKKRVRRELPEEYREAVYSGHANLAVACV